MSVTLISPVVSPTMSPTLVPTRSYNRNSMSFGKITHSPGFKSSTFDFSENAATKRNNRRSINVAGGSKTFAPHLASVILSRRKSIDGGDMMKNKQASSPVANATLLLADTPRLVRTRSLPCLASWDIYGEENIVVSFDSRRSSISSYTNLAEHLRSLGVYDSPVAKSSRGKDGTGAERIRQDDVIYELHKDKHYIVYATKEKLLKSLVDPRTDMEYITQYLATHLWHTTPGELLDRLIALFNPGMESKELFTTRMRVLCIVQQWSASFPKDLVLHKEKVAHFLEVIAPQAGFIAPEIEALSSPTLQAAPKPTLPKKVSEGMKHQFLDFHPTEIARQLTLIEHQRFRDLPRSEFVRQAWNKKDGATKSPQIVTAIKKFNEISYWVAAEIVFCANSKQRVATVKRMIQIANKCLTFNNFNTVMEIVAGLHMSSVQRLKKTWKALSSKYLSIFEEITKFIATEGNYRNYRNVLSKVELPATPYLGVFLRDLTFIEDGNPDFVEDDQFLNFEKMRMLNSVLAAISKYQRVPYNFEPVPSLQEYIIAGTSVNLNDAALHKYSLLCEPSSATGAASGSGTLTSSGSKRFSFGLK